MLSVKSDALRRHAELGIEGALGALVGHEFDPAHQPSRPTPRTRDHPTEPEQRGNIADQDQGANWGNNKKTKEIQRLRAQPQIESTTRTCKIRDDAFPL